MHPVLNIHLANSINANHRRQVSRRRHPERPTPPGDRRRVA